MPISAETYERVALEDREGHWELHCGELRRKPKMAAEHGHLARRLAAQLIAQLDPDRFEVATESGRLRRPSGTYYVPDVCVIPMSLLAPLLDRSGKLEVYDAPLPLVVEVWSPSTGDYDVDDKLPEYQRRGDREIWRLHPYALTLRALRQRDDGTYAESEHTGGVVEPIALPGVRIDLDDLFRFLR